MKKKIVMGIIHFAAIAAMISCSLLMCGFSSNEEGAHCGSCIANSCGSGVSGCVSCAAATCSNILCSACVGCLEGCTGFSG